MLFLRDISKTKLQNVKVYQEECMAQIIISDAVAYKTKSKKHYMDKEHQTVMKFDIPNYTAFKYTKKSFRNMREFVKIF